MYKLTFLLFFTILSQISFAQTKNFIDQPYIETNAQVDTLILPDRVYMSILITEKGSRGEESLENLETKMASKLKEIGIDLDKQLSVSDLSSNFRKYFLKKQDILKAKSYELLVYDATTAGQVIYELEDIGISNVDIERTDYSKKEELGLILKTRAIAKAHQQAEQIAQTINQRIGKAIHILDKNNHEIANALQGQVVGIRIRGMSSMANSKYEAVPLEFEKIKVSIQIEARFILN